MKCIWKKYTIKCNMKRKNKNGGRESRIQTFYKYSVGAPCSAFYVWVVETKGGIKRSF